MYIYIYRNVELGVRTDMLIRSIQDIRYRNYGRKECTGSYLGLYTAQEITHLRVPHPTPGMEALSSSLLNTMPKVRLRV